MRRGDRHGRTVHTDTDRRRRPDPGFRLGRRASIERVVRDALDECAADVGRRLTGAQVIVADVGPGSQVVTLEVGPDGAVRRLVVHRRALEQQAADRADAVSRLRDAIEDAAADAAG